MPTPTSSFLAPKGNYKNLIVYRKSECIYDITCYFIEHYLPQMGDRTVDQMKQAARSGKQNIAEGNETGTTSTEANIKLMNVAKASLKELQEDYEDYLRTHGHTPWEPESQQARNARAWCRQHDNPRRLRPRLPRARRHYVGQYRANSAPPNRLSASRIAGKAKGRLPHTRRHQGTDVAGTPQLARIAWME